MPRIPGFETRSRIGMNVPETPIEPTSQMGSVLANIGGEVAQFGVELEKRRKLAADARDVANKTLDLEKDHLETSLQLQNARLEDGTLRPDVVGWKDEAKGQKYTYAEKMQEFWDGSFQEYSKTMASPEAEAQFLRANRPKARKSILTAEAETLTMEADSFRKAEAEVFRSTTNGILINPETDIDTLLAVSEPVMDSHQQLYQDGLIDETTYLAEDKKRSREMTLATLDNFVRNKRPDDILSLVYAGNLPKNYEKTLRAAQNVWAKEGAQQLRETFATHVQDGRMTQEELDSRIATIEKRVAIDPEVVLKYRGDSTAEKLSGSLSRKEIEKYLRAAGRLKVNDSIYSKQEVLEDTKALKKRLGTGEINTNTTKGEEQFSGVLERRTQVDAAELDNKDVLASYKNDIVDLFLLKNTQSFGEESLNMSETQFQGAMEEIRANPQEAAENLLADFDYYIEQSTAPWSRDALTKAKQSFEKSLKGGPGGQIVAQKLETFARNRQEIRAKQRKNLMKDPGGFFDTWVAKGDPNLTRPGPKRIQRIDEVMNNLEIGTHYAKYASDGYIQDFRQKFEEASDEGKARLMANERSQWGGVQNWLKVQDQYIEGANLPKEMSLAFMMPDVESMQRLIGVTLPERRESIRQGYKAQEKNVDIATLSQAVRENEVVRSFSEALASGSDSSLEVVEPTQDIIDALTTYTIATYNPDADTKWLGNNSVERVVNNTVSQILEKNFNIVSDGDSTIISPTMPSFSAVSAEQGRMDTPSMDEMEAFLRDYSAPDKLSLLAKQPENFKEFAKYFDQLDPEDGELWERALEEHTYWATLPDMSGVGLRFRTKTNAQVSNDPKDPFSGLVPGKDGKPITFKWKDISASTITRGPNSFTIPGAQ